MIQTLHWKIAIARELLEETGYRFSNYEYLGKTSSNPSTNNNWMHMYLATGGRYEREQELDHNEEIEIYLFSVDEVKKLTGRKPDYPEYACNDTVLCTR